MIGKFLVRRFVEPYLPIARLQHSAKFRNPKVKLVAVAKNEARYLPEWIFHHLYFGISAIDIYYNQCDDNTVELGDYLESHYPVNFINADASFAPHLVSPQVQVYRDALSKASKEGYSHVLLLDVDEFFTPKDLTETIPAMLKKKRSFDVVCGNWTNLIETSEPFSRTIQPELSLEVSPTVKSLVKSYVRPPQMNPHIPISQKLTYGMTGKAVYQTDRADMSKILDGQKQFEQAEFFVIHRQYRSEMEYVAMLGRGRPIEAKKRSSIFKNNRRGYNVVHNRTSLSFDTKAYDAYTSYIDDKFLDERLGDLLSAAEATVVARFNKVKEMIRSADASEVPLLKKLLRNITLSDVQHAYESLQQKAMHSNK